MRITAYAHRSFLLAACTGLFLTAFVNPGAVQSSRRKSSAARHTETDDAKIAAMRFRVGEALNYQVSWATFISAASVRLSVPERRDLFGWNTWHFRAQIHTLSPVRSLFTIDDQFDSYTDTGTLDSRQYEMYFDELGKKRDEILHFVPKGTAARIPGPGVVVLPGTQDPLGALYALRGFDWQKTPQYTVLVYDGQNLYEMHARLEAAGESVAVPAGNYSASRISIHLSQYGKEVTGINFSIWLAHDLARTPVRIRADLPFGSVEAALMSASQ